MSEWRKTRRKAEEALEMLHTFQTFSVCVNFPDFGVGWQYSGQLWLGIYVRDLFPEDGAKGHWKAISEQLLDDKKGEQAFHEQDAPVTLCPG